MIYKYHCVNCGNQLNGEEIRFDLSELIGVRDASDVTTKANPAALISPSVLEANAENGGNRLVHGMLCPITISLDIYLGILGRSTGRTKEMLSYGHNDDDLTKAVTQLVITMENAEIAQERIGYYIAIIKTLFVTDKAHEGSDDNKDYKRTFYVKPEYFENGQSQHMYSLEYAYDANSPVTKKIRAPQPIRGYCPKCGKPVLLNAGKYPHVLVGMIGAKGVGKTTLILSMLQEIETNYNELGIEFPGDVLCDSNYYITRNSMELFNKGWLTMKTSAMGANSYNVSLLLEKTKTHNKMLITFAEIAGEQCYDPNINAMRPESIEELPLINKCDVYILCTCFNQAQRLQNEILEVEQHPQTVMMIANEIYGDLTRNRSKNHKTPPLCIVMTKADVVADAKVQSTDNNPFDTIEVPEGYRYKSQFNNLSMTYMTFGEKKIREPLESCCNVYSQLKEKTYVSMMACSATGIEGDVWKWGSPILMNKNGRFMPLGVNTLVQWVFQTIGLSPVSGEYRFSCVPSRDEIYVRALNGEEFRTDHFTDQGAGKRCASIPYVFLNPSKTDYDIMRASKQPYRARGFLRNLVSPILRTLKEAGVLMDN